MHERQAILAGFIVGIFLVYEVQSVDPLTVFLSPPLSADWNGVPYGNPISGILTYLTIPLVVGAVASIVEREKALLEGAICGFILGFLNLVVSDYQFMQIPNYVPVSSQLRAQFFLFAEMLVLLWTLLTAFSAKAVAWSLEKNQANTSAKKTLHP